MDGFVARPPDRTLHDPCWRAARARTVEEKPRWQQQPTFEKSFHDTPVLKRQIWGWQKNPKKYNGYWHVQSLPMGGAAGNWEGTKFEQEFPWSVQVCWTGCCNDQFLHVGLVCYDTTIHLICAVYKSMIKYLAEYMASLTSFHYYINVETEFIGLTIDFTSLCWNVSQWNAG